MTTRTRLTRGALTALVGVAGLTLAATAQNGAWYGSPDGTPEMTGGFGHGPYNAQEQYYDTRTQSRNDPGYTYAPNYGTRYDRNNTYDPYYDNTYGYDGYDPYYGAIRYDPYYDNNSGYDPYFNQNYGYDPYASDFSRGWDTGSMYDGYGYDSSYTGYDSPYGWGGDVYDDRWDTGLWDMGEYDVDEYYTDDWNNDGAYAADDDGWFDW